ncbi:MAG: hypothetical protein JJE27_08600, partial [Thermoleophilia bacterium]|nr:hypothetical protein [Thermoleophilia bacterium]
MAHRLRFRRAAGQATSSQIGFGSQAYERLARRVDAAQVKARSRGRTVIAGVTVPVAAGIDPLLRVAGMLDGSERWSYFEQPARGGHAIAALGEAALASASGPNRFADIARDCATLLGAAEVDDLADDSGAPPGAGPVW